MESKETKEKSKKTSIFSRWKGDSKLPPRIIFKEGKRVKSQKLM